MISLSPELIFKIWGFPVTNAVIATVIIDVLIFVICFVISKEEKLIPRGIHSIFEPIVEYLYTMTEQIAGSKTMTIFPWFASFFLFILFSNFISLVPGLGSIGFWSKADGVSKLTPLFRSASSDPNMTFALGTISLVATHAIALKYNGIWGYIKKFVSLNPIFLFVGLLELTLEPVKILSLSFRLFGNIFSGEVVLSTVAGLFAFLVPIPFLLLESITAIVQALVFSMLTMAFMAILATTEKEGGGH